MAFTNAGENLSRPFWNAALGQSRHRVNGGDAITGETSLIQDIEHGLVNELDLVFR